MRVGSDVDSGAAISGRARTAAVSCAPFGAAPDGTPVDRWTLQASGGFSAAVLTYGATLHTLLVPDADGEPGDVVLSLSSTDAYARHDAYLGALVGRYANRIAGARFTLDGTTHAIAANEGANTLHGGPDGFHRRVWTARGFADRDRAGVALTLRSTDGDMGFPGTLDVEAVYTLEADTASGGTLRVDYRAVTDRPTVVSLTQHAYFNLAGGGPVGGHELAVYADAFLPVDEHGIPLGAATAVAGTPFALDGAPLEAVFAADDPHIASAGGLDHCFVLRGGRTPEPRLAARLAEPVSGRVMETWTTEPGLQVYTANHLGAPFGARSAVCLETQAFPDAPNRPDYPSAVVRPGEEYRSATEYRFTTA